MENSILEIRCIVCDDEKGEKMRGKSYLFFIGTIVLLLVIEMPFAKAQNDETLESHLQSLEDICKHKEDVRKMQIKVKDISMDLSERTDEKIVLNRLISEYRNKEKEWKYRHVLLNVLSGAKDEIVTKAIIDGLRDDNKELRAGAAWALGERRGSMALNPLIVSLNNDENNKVRANAAYALGQLKDKKALKHLRKRVEDEDQVAAMNSIWALGEIADASSVDLLLRLFDEGNETVKINVLIALGKIDTGRAADFMLEVSDSLTEKGPVRVLAREMVEKKGGGQND